MDQENHLPSREGSTYYQITIREHLDPRWSEWFENMAIKQLPDGKTTLIGQLQDRTALYGLINKIRDMGLTLLAVDTPVRDRE